MLPPTKQYSYEKKMHILEQAHKVTRKHVPPGLLPRFIQQLSRPPPILRCLRYSDDIPRLEIKLFVDRCSVVVQSFDIKQYRPPAVRVRIRRRMLSPRRLRRRRPPNSRTRFSKTVSWTRPSVVVPHLLIIIRAVHDRCMMILLLRRILATITVRTNLTHARTTHNRRTVPSASTI